MNPEALQNLLNEKTCELGISHWGMTELIEPASFSHYRNWIDQGFHGEMTYLAEHLPLKKKPQLYAPSMNSALVFAFPYSQDIPGGLNFPWPHLQVARYAKGKDYHRWVKSRLNDLQSSLKKNFPEENFLVTTDSAPLMERDLAQRAGLGWIGKNSCVIDRNHGSFFLLGEILTSLPLKTALETPKDFCGTCQKCLEVCPTQAFESPRVLNATKCISYWTIESRKIPPPEIREGIGEWLFGCDLCQSVCPWNQKLIKPQIGISSDKGIFSIPQNAKSGEMNSVELNSVAVKTGEPNPQKKIEELRSLLTLGTHQLSKKTRGTPLARAGAFGLRRNALVVIGNLRLKELADEVARWKTDPRLGELAHWCEQRLEKP